MYILQISDFHISTQSNIEAFSIKLKQLYSKIIELIPNQENVLCCMLGDFIEQGDKNSYAPAKTLLTPFITDLRKNFSNNNIEFEVVPGNHDLCFGDTQSGKKDLLAFNRFASELLGKTISFSDSTPFNKSHYFGYDVLSINSVLSGEINFGFIDQKALYEQNLNSYSIVLAHHGVVSSEDNDASAIRNGYMLHQFLEEKNCASFLHGHTHGFRRYTIGNDCQIIGVGPILKNVGEFDISNQCNLIKFTGGSVREVTSLIYQGDRTEWDVINVYTKIEDYNYVDNSASSLYRKVLLNAEENSLLPNLRLQIQSSYTDFEKDIVNNFSTYKDDATEWQSEVSVDKLEYTHGQQMNTTNITWYEFVTNLLRQNPTTKRAIIPLIDKEKAFLAKDDQYLVSLDVIQLGFSSNQYKTLYITVYFRALEVRHFLPINLYEIYIIAKKLKSEFPSIENVNICLFTYRAEAKQNYSCFKKTGLDLISESEICKLYSTNDYSTLISHLEEKRNSGDTVIDISWLQRLINATKQFCVSDIVDELIAQLYLIEEKLNILKEERIRCSDYSLTQSFENNYCNELDKLIELFKRIACT